MVEVPFLTNDFEVEKGEELILEVPDPQKTAEGKPGRRTWKDAFHDQEKQRIKTQTEQKAMQKKANTRQA